jgi:GH24 family phage-related lysozyme (muramidase)
LNRARIGIGALVLSATGLVGLITHESYTGTAIIPVAGDRPTVGFGSTFRDDGTPVKLGDTITPPKAVARTLAHIGKDETRLKACVTAPLHQAEYDLLVDHAYQYGAVATCSSSIVRLVNAGRYAESCDGYMAFRFMTSAAPRKGWEPFQFDKTGKPIRWRMDCAQAGSGCRGVALRAAERKAKCLEAQR